MKSRFFFVGIIAALAFALVNSCSSGDSSKHLDIKSRVRTNDLPSGSGIISYRNRLFSIGDDSSWLFEILNYDSANGVCAISNNNKNTDGRVDWNQKLDLEDLDLCNYDNRELIIAICSGSKAIFRDSIFVLDAQTFDLVSKKNIRSLYDKLVKISGIEKINIEGICSSSDKVYMGHRGNLDKNIIFEFDKNLFFKYLFNNVEIEEFNTFELQLDKLHHQKPGLSALEFDANSGNILFTCSIEAHSNSSNDGEIGGSFAGFFDIKSNNIIALFPFLDQNGEMLKSKVEGICIESFDAENRLYHIAAVSDNDDGFTEIYKLNINL